MLERRMNYAPVGELLTDIAGVNEYQAAVIQDDRPAPTWISNMNVANVHAISGSWAEILYYHAATKVVKTIELQPS